jgi:NADPH-dependent glutamate synthase beta subunit-like oxidoreductase
MANVTCPVKKTIDTLSDRLATGALKSPRTYRITEEILQLLEDVAWGRAGSDHLTALYSHADELIHSASDNISKKTGELVHTVLSEHEEVIASHVDTHTCATGDCVRLAPAPCQMACPAGIDIPTYVTLIGQGKDAEAIDIIRRDNPFPWVCGLVCTRPCEFMCVRARIDTPISIKFLKAFAAERALSEGRYRNPLPEPPNHRKVAIIGAGPGGMTAAYYLALEGYTVRVIETLPMAGGMIMVGIPRYRLPREVIDREVAMLERLGVEFHYNTRFGTDISLDQLRTEGFEAFLFAIGAHQCFKLGIPGEQDYPQVVDAIDFLRDVALGDRHVPGNRVVVIGGGNVAIDAARTCLRLGSETVTIVYRRTRNEMPADTEEVEQAEEEGVKLSFLSIPVEVVGTEGQLTALKCLRAELIEKEGSDRKSPVPITDSDYFENADMIIGAIGQRVDDTCMADLSELNWTRRNTISVNRADMRTSVDGIFACGDAVTGPATVVEAIGGGKKAAMAIDRYLSGLPQTTMPPVPSRRGRVDMITVPASTKMVLKHPAMPLLNIDRRRTTFQQVELGYSENQVREEARRCLRCDVCLRCGKCVEVCRDKMQINALQLGYFDFDNPVQTDFRLTEERCIACGACAANCPTGAMVIEDQGDERILSLCGTILNRQKLAYCDACGVAAGPLKYLEYVRKRTDKVGPVSDDKILCDACARDRTARFTADIHPV